LLLLRKKSVPMRSTAPTIRGITGLDVNPAMIYEIVETAATVVAYGS
jgi:hypothetical protein